jgi:hypothetical protein
LSSLCASIALGESMWIVMCWVWCPETWAVREVRKWFYMKLHKFCNTYDIVILLVVACIVMFVSSNHAVHWVVVVLVVDFAYKFIICVVSPRFVILCFNVIILCLQIK